MKYSTILLVITLIGCSTNKESNIIKDFEKLSQSEKKHVLPFILDTLDHEMYGIGVTKTKEELQKNGGLPGYYISHYPSYTSGGLVLPVLRVHDHNGKLVETLIGGSLSKDAKSILNIGGFSKPFDFNEVRIYNEEIDKKDATIRQKIVSGTEKDVTMKYYSTKFIQAIPQKDFVEIDKYQNAALGKGYDIDCIATAIRETEEETGMKLNKDEMILLDIHSSVLEQVTKSDYTIKTSSTGVCYFMFEMGDVHLGKDGKIKEIKINSKAIKNADKTSANINYDTENNILLKGFDDAEDGIKFIRKSSLKKDFASNNTSYNYTVSDYGSKNFNVVVSVGDAFALVPNSIKYKTCHPLIFRTIGKFMPSKNNIGAQEIISRYAPKTLCNIE